MIDDTASNDLKKLLQNEFDQPTRDPIKTRAAKPFLPFLNERDALGRLIKPPPEPEGNASQTSWTKQKTKFGKFHKKTPSASSAFSNFTNKSSLTNMVSVGELSLKNSNLLCETENGLPLNKSISSLNEYAYILRPGSKENTFNCSPASRKKSFPTKDPDSKIFEMPVQTSLQTKHDLFALDFTNKGFKANLLENLTIMKSRAFAGHEMKLIKPQTLSKENPPLGHYNIEKGLELGRASHPAPSFGVRRELITSRFLDYQRRTASTETFLPAVKPEAVKPLEIPKRKVDEESLRTNEHIERKHFNEIKGRIVRNGKFSMGACKHRDVHPEELARDMKRVRENVKSKKAYYMIMMEQMADRMNAQLRRDYQEDYRMLANKDM